MKDDIKLQPIDEMFNHVAHHMLTQMYRSLTKHGYCAYRGTRGLQCAIGSLIADEHYELGYESAAATSPLILEAIQRSGWKFPEDENQLALYHQCLNDLQNIHDKHPEFYWPQSLKEIARSYGIYYLEPMEATARKKL